MQASIRQDGCSDNEQLMRSMGPGLYTVNTPSNDCYHECTRELNPDPYLRFQKYGNSSCPFNNSVDDESSLRRLEYKLSNCNRENYQPGDYTKTGCKVKSGDKRCIFPSTEDTRLSNNACNLKGTGINRYAFFPCDEPSYNPQSWAIQEFDRVPTDTKALFKHNHTPCLETPMNDDKILPPIENNKFNPAWTPNSEALKHLNTLSNNYYGHIAPPKSC